MKNTIFILVCAILLLSASPLYAQAMKDNANPYKSLSRNLTVWYGTQAAPTPLEKAQWALDDINAYRSYKGLPEFTIGILDTPLDLDDVFNKSKPTKQRRLAIRRR